MVKHFESVKLLSNPYGPLCGLENGSDIRALTVCHRFCFLCGSFTCFLPVHVALYLGRVMYMPKALSVPPVHACSLPDCQESVGGAQGPL